MKKQIVAFFLAMTMALSLVYSCPSVSAAEPDMYVDVPVGVWYFQPVTFCTELGLMNGIGRGEFSPDGSMNRAMFVTILHRLAGAPDASPWGFTDVTAGSYYAKAVDWAAGEGIVNGTGDSTFSPEKSILRQDMACMLARYLVKIDAEILRGDACEQYFCDMDLVSDYARDAVDLMRRTGLFQGDGHPISVPWIPPIGQKRPHCSPALPWKWGSSPVRVFWNAAVKATPYLLRIPSGYIAV